MAKFIFSAILFSRPLLFPSKNRLNMLPGTYLWSLVKIGGITADMLQTLSCVVGGLWCAQVEVTVKFVQATFLQKKFLAKFFFAQIFFGQIFFGQIFFWPKFFQGKNFFWQISFVEIFRGVKSVQDGPRNLPLKFGKNQVTNSWEIP